MAAITTTEGTPSEEENPPWLPMREIPEDTLNLEDRVEIASSARERGDDTLPPFIQPIETWIINSGASNHICKSPERFGNLKPATSSIREADEKAIAITEKGELEF